MNRSHNASFYISFADVSCKVTAPVQWKKYFHKLYEYSSILQYSDINPRHRHTATLTISVNTTADVSLEFIAGKNFETYTIKASDMPIFLFPSVHQFVARILNIMFHKSGGFVLHASSVYLNRRALIFVGESGRGKSTIADILKKTKPETYILSDNSAFIKEKQGKFYLFPSPYLEANRLALLQSPLPKGIPYPITAVYFPFHAQKTKTSPLAFSECLRLIQQNSHIPYAPHRLFTHKEGVHFGMTIFSFIKSVDMYKLEFVKDKSFIYHIQ